MALHLSSSISKHRVFIWPLIVASAGFAIACGDEDAPTWPGTGGTGGTENAAGAGDDGGSSMAGKAGTATGGSAAGSAGKGGVAGAAGTSLGGTSGGSESGGSESGGTAGTGGTTDTGGTGGTGGTSDTAGTAGTGGTAPSCTVPLTGGVDFSALLLGPKLVEAESASLSGSATTATQGSGWSGAGFADMKASEGGMTWLIDVPANGEYVLDWTYTQDAERDMRLTVDCTQVVESVPFLDTGNWYTAWTKGGAQKVQLTKGVNQIVLETNGDSGANFDSMIVTPPTCVVADDAATTCEAERALMLGSTGLASEGSGWKDLGFADMFGSEGAVNWVLDVPQAGTYKLTFVYTEAEARGMTLKVNGVAAASLAFKKTGSWNTAWASDVTYDVTLKQGINSVQLATNGHSGPNIDSVIVSEPGSSSGGAGGAGGADGNP